MRVEAAVDDRRVDVDVGISLLDDRDALRARRRCTRCGRAGAGARSRSRPATALPPVASIGSIISTKLVAETRRQLRVVLRRHGGRLVALQAEVADARAGHELEHGVEHAEPRAQHRHDDDIAGHAGGRAPARAASATITSRVGTSRSASAASSTLMRVGGAAELLRRRRARVAQRDERVLNERMVDEVDGHGGHYTIADCQIAANGRLRPSTVNGDVDAINGDCRRLLRIAAADKLRPCSTTCARIDRRAGARPSCTPRRPRRRPVALIVTGGTVVTMDAARRVLTPGAVAIDGADIVASARRTRSGRRTRRPAPSTRAEA